MKRLFSISSLIACLLLLNACSKNDDNNTKPSTEVGSYAMWVQVGSWPNVSYYIMGLNSVTEGTATLSGNGVDVTSVLNASVIKRDSFYYYYNTTEGRFGKYQIVNGAAKAIKEVPFTNFASLAGHTWIDENTLVMIGTNSAATAINYSTVNVTTMTITNGTFTGLPALPAGYNAYRVGGDLQYVNGNLFFAVGFRNPDFIMYAGISEIQASYPGFKIGDISTDTRTSGMGNTSGYFATSFVDKNKDMYFLTSWVSKWAGGTGNAPIYIYRIKNGETKLDAGYHVKVSDVVGFEAASGLFMDLGNGTALLKYIISTVDNNSTYGYTIINLSTGTEVKKLAEIPAGAGSERNVFVENGKAYIAVVSGQATDYIWIYDSATGAVTKGTAISGGYNSISRIERLK
ncbi:hypothetical protein SAMN05428949_1085 [Chitinophaga sp. YR627]|uniref:hypothetical protein n=1 Tax=Chitinophaga sp. YR627 TaxID=1881041 RepID=UPI0008E939DE|nr:hypothetical protein [Chitinophaga sp. YR627]SFM86253.1 hypothetical protein SAMN05428949_1085 [Chitinophaga sp. YR627]